MYLYFWYRVLKNVSLFPNISLCKVYIAFFQFIYFIVIILLFYKRYMSRNEMKILNLLPIFSLAIKFLTGLTCRLK